MLGVVDDRVAEFRQLVEKILGADVHALELRQLLLRLVLLVQAGVDDLVAVGDLVARTRMDHHLLGGFMHRQQLAQLDERLLARFRVDALNTSSNMSLIKSCWPLRNFTTSSVD